MRYHPNCAYSCPATVKWHQQALDSQWLYTGKLRVVTVGVGNQQRAIVVQDRAARAMIAWRGAPHIWCPLPRDRMPTENFPARLFLQQANPSRVGTAQFQRGIYELFKNIGWRIGELLG